MPPLAEVSDAMAAVATCVLLAAAEQLTGQLTEHLTGQTTEQG